VHIEKPILGLLNHFWENAVLQMLVNPTPLLHLLAQKLFPLELLPICQAFFCFVIVNRVDYLRLTAKVIALPFDHIYLIVYKPNPLFLDIIY
jgi:hypothetical protein